MISAAAVAALVAVVVFPAGISGAIATVRAPAYAASGVSTIPDTVRVLMPGGSVVTMDMDEYLKGVVPAEADPSWNMDALEAQAVAARCYAATAHNYPNADVDTTTRSQVWTSAHDPRTDLAVEATHKVAALYQGEVIQAYYFAHCNGHTKNSEDVWGLYVPYCRAVPCPCGHTTMDGHGVGMCQDGAQVLAQAGWDYQDILKHYYTGVTVESTEAAALVWYFAEGTTRPGFVTYFCLANPSDSLADVTLTYLLEDGRTVEKQHAVAPHARTTVVASADVGAGNDFSCRVASMNGVGIIAERPMYFSYGSGWTGGHDTMGATEPKADWYFAEGTTREDFVTYLCVANPSDSQAAVTVSYYLESGESKDTLHFVPPHTRQTIDASSDIGADKDFSCKVSSANGVGIVAERPMYFDYRASSPAGQPGWTGGHDAMGAPYPKTDWYFAEGTTRSGFATYFCLANPTDSNASVTVTYMYTDGFNQDVKYTVAPRSRMTIDASSDVGAGKDFSCRISSTNRTPIIAERPMYFSYGSGWTGGHDTMGTPYPKPDWYFAEGTARPGFVTYVCVQNTSDKTADVKLRYLRGNGTTAEQVIAVARGSRSTISANDFLGTADDAAHDFALQVTCTNNAPIVVERPMYFCYAGVWTGGHDTMGR